MNVAERLELDARANPQKAALLFNNQPVSYLQLKETTFQLANALLALGVKRGDRVALHLPNCPEYVFSYLAVWSIGAIAVPLDFMLTETELISCISHSEAKVLVAQHKPSVSLPALKEGCPTLQEVVVCREELTGFRSFNDFLRGGVSDNPGIAYNEKDEAIIFYTSGTTGRPKGVLVNYRQLSAPAESMDHFVEFKRADVAICALPLSHVGGLIYFQVSLPYGFTVVLMERFAPVDFLKKVANHKVNWFWLVPSMYYALLQLKEFETYDLSSLRWIVTFGASSSPEALRRFHQYCPQAHLINGWGMTETQGPTVVMPRGSKKIESVGRSAPWTQVRVFDDGDREVRQGEVGEVVIKSWVVTDGYYRDRELTQATLRNGWFHTGDLGRFDAEGDLFIVGRKKEMIKVAGEIVFEPEVEAALHRHPEVAEVAVVGVPDKLRGEVPAAYVVTKPQSPLTADDLRSFARQHLAHFKVPHYFEFRVSLPKNRTGKVDKAVLRQEAKALRSP